ncbi:thiol-disulfide oxidoreductase DCC family protein [Marivirga arenosa]|uniref:Thiol-disulfide oxidoreductase DCC family protein n=1 Tax=Marivirga arenosa TaxID=3059076 RepID=A0AA49GDW5_9BACT|nr:thiol-disulfide oxidoreductase DCC family protein [Marivirga sp. BKB1-2]WKK79186.2 thiol-disulfide oxidoreductase DCC family protein [Marivirga sp. BKB1-2]
MKNSNPIIYFDGICNLCNGAVNYIIDRDSKAIFKFAPLQSKHAEKNLPVELIKNTDSIILQVDGNFYQKSTAALKIASQLGGFWKLFYVFIILPPFLRDFIYDIIAKNRYKWFGKRDVCRLPTPELKNRFLEMD